MMAPHFRLIFGAGVLLSASVSVIAIRIQAGEVRIDSTNENGIQVVNKPDDLRAHEEKDAQRGNGENGSDVGDARQLVWDRNDAFVEFHERFKSEFASITDRFGFSRMVASDSEETNHSLCENPRIWIFVQTSFGTRFDPKHELLDDEFNACLPRLLCGGESCPPANTSTSHFPVPVSDGLSDAFSGGHNNHLFANHQKHRRIKGAWTYPAFNSPASTVEWQLDRLQLIGLLNHSPPVIYDSSRIPLRTIPSANEFKGVPTKSLNSFEQLAIERLRSSHDEIVVSETEDKIQIVGALRASEQCMKCHAVRQGDLLGALTYELNVAWPVPWPVCNSQ